MGSRFEGGTKWYGAGLLLVFPAIGAVTFGSASTSLADDDGCGSGNNPYNRPDGTLIQGPGTPVYLIEGCQKVWIPWFEDYTSHRFLNTVAQVSTAEINATGSQGYQLRGREGTILRSPADYLYIINEISPGNYEKRYITSTAFGLWFGPCSYSYQHYQSVSYDYLNTYPNGLDVGGSRPDGMLLQAPSPNLQIYLIENSQKRYIEGTPTHFDGLNSYNFLQPVCPASQAEINGYTQLSPAKRAREGTLFNSSGGPVYIVERDPNLGYWKRWILSADAFNYYGLSWGNIQNWYGPRVDTYTTTAHVHPYKGLFVDRWYRNLTTSSLTMDRSYFSGIPPSAWDGAITGARSAWDSTPTTVNFTDYGQAFNVNNDIHVSVDYQPWPDGGMSVFRSSVGGPSCADPPDCPATSYRQVDVYMNHSQVAANLRQATVAHELGHAVTLAHDGLNDPPGENKLRRSASARHHNGL